MNPSQAELPPKLQHFRVNAALKPAGKYFDRFFPSQIAEKAVQPFGTVVSALSPGSAGY
jgi:hypothetical protein